MDLTRLDLPEKRVLRALFELAQRDHPARPDVLARVLDLDPSMVERTLTALERQRLVSTPSPRCGAAADSDASRTRLTLSGLAVATRIPALPRATLWFLGDDDEPEDAQDDEHTLGAC